MKNKLDMGSFVVYLPTQFVNQVNVSLLFNENNINDMQIQSDQCFVVLKDADNLNIPLVVKQVFSLLRQHGATSFNKEVKIIIVDDKDKQKIQGITNSEDIKYVLTKLDENISNKKNQVLDSDKEKEKNEVFVKFWDANVVQKNDNGILKKYIHRKGDEHNIGYMLEGIQLRDLFGEFKKLESDEQFMTSIQHLNEEEIANKLLDSIALSRNLKKYYMEGANEIQNADANIRENVVSNLAESKDGVGNTEIGVVNYSSQNVNPYKAVEQDGDKMRVVSPNVVSNNGLSSGTGDVSYSVDSYNDNVSLDNVSHNGEMSDEYVDNQLQEEQLQSREVRKENVRKRVLVRPTTNNNYGFSSFAFYIIVAVIVLFIIGIVIM